MADEFKLTQENWEITPQDIDKACERIIYDGYLRSRYLIEEVARRNLDDPDLFLGGSHSLVKNMIIYGLVGHAAVKITNDLASIAVVGLLKRQDYNAHLNTHFSAYFLDEPFEISDSPKLERLLSLFSRIRNYEKTEGASYPGCPLAERQLQNA